MSDPARRTLGLLIGGAVGVAAHWALLRSGVHLLAAVGAGVALGAGWPARRRSLAWGALVAVLAVLISIVVEWLFRPFASDRSFGHFVGHLADLPRNSLVSLLVAAGLGFWFGMGRNRKAGGAA